MLNSKITCPLLIDRKEDKICHLTVIDAVHHEESQWRIDLKTIPRRKWRERKTSKENRDQINLKKKKKN